MGQIEFERIKSLLESSGVEFKISVHDAVFTSQEAADIRKVGLHRGVKALVVQSNDKRFFLFCLPADRKADLKKAARLAGVDRLFLASKEDVLRVTGCVVGCVPPFAGVLSGIPVFFDESILRNEFVDFSVGLHTHSVEMKSADLLALMNPMKASFSL